MSDGDSSEGDGDHSIAGGLDGAIRERLRARGHRVEALEALPGDVSARRYARCRLAGGTTAILAVYPPETRDVHRRFRRTTALLEGVGMRVPAILDHDPGTADELGWMLVEDLGAASLFELHAGWPERLPWYRDALRQLALLDRVAPPAVAALNPPLDEALLRRELEQTWDTFLRPRGLLGSALESDRLRDALDALCRALGASAPVVCHRDFMARNLVPLPAERCLGVLDHQDLRLGPPHYDLASLLNDSLFPPPELEARLLAPALADRQARRAYRRAAAQRTLKALGTFATCAARGSRRYDVLVAPTLDRALAHLAALPETTEAGAALAARVRARGDDLLD